MGRSLTHIARGLTQSTGKSNRVERVNAGSHREQMDLTPAKAVKGYSQVLNESLGLIGTKRVSVQEKAKRQLIDSLNKISGGAGELSRTSQFD
jgi:hypothetical protein